MAKNKALWFPIYVRDYLSDANVAALTISQEGAYLRLLFFMFNEGGYLPLDDRQLATISKLGKHWPKHKETIIGLFVVTRQETSGQLIITHSRILSELEKFGQISNNRALSGAKGAAKRWQMPSKKMANGWQSDSQHNTTQHNTISSSIEEDTLVGADAADLARGETKNVETEADQQDRPVSGGNMATADEQGQGGVKTPPEEKNGSKALKTRKPKNDQYSEEYEKAWAFYGRRGSKPKGWAHWQALTDEDKQTIRQHMPAYIKHNDGDRLQFRAYIEGYLARKLYLGVVPTEQTNKQTTHGYPNRSGAKPISELTSEQALASAARRADEYFT